MYDLTEINQSTCVVFLVGKHGNYTDFSAPKTTPEVLDPIQDTLANKRLLSFILLTFKFTIEEVPEIVLIFSPVTNDSLIPYSLAISELFETASVSAATFNLKAKLYEDQ